MEFDPRDLLRKAKQGDAEAFGRLYELYFTPIYRYLYLRLSERETAEDLAQQVFLKVFKTIGDYQEQGKPLAYFFTVARNKLIDHWRRKKEIGLEAAERVAGGLSAPAEESAAKADRAAAGKILEKVMSVLPDEQREIIVLKFINEFSNREIAGLTGKSEEAVRQIQCRALKRMREELAGSKKKGE